MGGCNPTRSLRDEHVLILRVADALERLLNRGPAAASAGEAGDFADFFRLYADALHHGQEEGVLFEAMVEQGFSTATGPIAHMLEEHRLGRALVRRMGEAAATLEQRSDAWREFHHAAGSYIDLIRHHILKEDHGVFDMADEALDEPACRKVCAAYETACGARFEGRTRDDLEAVGARLAERYTD